MSAMIRETVSQCPNYFLPTHRIAHISIVLSFGKSKFCFGNLKNIMSRFQILLFGACQRLITGCGAPDGDAQREVTGSNTFVCSEDLSPKTGGNSPVNPQ